MSYNIFYEQYAPLLNSDNENMVKNAFQEIFELLVTGSRMARSKKGIFTQLVGIHVKSNSQKVRKWAYHCACFYQDESVCQSIKKQLETERNKENILWALTALSVVYDDIVQLKQCVGRRHEEFVEMISENYLTDALVLFGGVVNINPNTILLTNNSSDLAALTKIYAYRGLVLDKYSNVTGNIIREMEKNDDPYVREYAYWSQVLGGANGNFLDSSNDSDVGARKWQIALQIQSGDEDFIVSALKPLALCPQKIHQDIKNGMLRGLNKVSYSIKYVPYINSWFEREMDDSIVILLIDYIIANCYVNREDGTYFDALKDSLNDQSLVTHIISKIENNPQYELCVAEHKEKYTLDFKIKEGMTMQSINIYGERNTIAAAADHSSATVTTSCEEVSELAKLIQNVKNEARVGLSEGDKQKVDEGLSFVESETKENSPRKTIIKMTLDGLKAIKGTVQFASAVAALIKFFE